MCVPQPFYAQHVPKYMQKKRMENPSALREEPKQGTPISKDKHKDKNKKNQRRLRRLKRDTKKIKQPTRNLGPHTASKKSNLVH